jgi:hypothetical protein
MWPKGRVGSVFEENAARVIASFCLQRKLKRPENRSINLSERLPFVGDDVRFDSPHQPSQAGVVRKDYFGRFVKATPNPRLLLDPVNAGREFGGRWMRIHHREPTTILSEHHRNLYAVRHIELR